MLSGYRKIADVRWRCAARVEKYLLTMMISLWGADDLDGWRRKKLSCAERSKMNAQEKEERTGSREAASYGIGSSTFYSFIHSFIYQALLPKSAGLSTH